MTFEKNGRGLKAIAAVIVASSTLACAVAANAQTRHFSFGGVEFLPRDERVPAAKAFVANELTPGTPIPAALEILKHADTWCRTPRTLGQPITCSHASFESHPDNGIIDVMWTVRVTPSADGAVSTATVTRSTYGF